MQPLLRKVLVALVAVSLAAAGGFVPRHAQAKGQGTHHGTAAHGHGADHAHHHTAKPHDHAQAEPGADCHNDAAPAETDGAPVVNCCIASCSAIALIFAVAALPELPRGQALVPSVPHSLVLAARTSDDPPPR